MYLWGENLTKLTWNVLENRDLRFDLNQFSRTRRARELGMVLRRSAKNLESYQSGNLKGEDGGEFHFPLKLERNSEKRSPNLMPLKFLRFKSQYLPWHF